jgi:hypothetical protein
VSSRHALQGLDRRLRALAAVETAEPDADQLAREVTQAFADELALYRRLREAQPELLNPAERPEGGELDAIRTKLPEQVTFADIDRLARVDPAEAAAQWEAVKAAARNDLDRGWLAARALAYMGGSAWERACFLAVRDRLRRAWQPRNDGEALLIDEMAQYELVRLWWIGVLAMRSRDPMTVTNRKFRGEREEERRQNAAEATFEAGRMVERLQRLFQNAVRLLVNLRRGKATVVYQRSGQVNVGVGQQMNVGLVEERVGDEEDADANGSQGRRRRTVGNSQFEASP